MAHFTPLEGITLAFQPENCFEIMEIKFSLPYFKFRLCAISPLSKISKIESSV